jgi:hypothetical protein
MTAKKPDDESNTRPGIGVDSRGGGVIDPTKNVEDLVKALKETLESFRTSDQRYVDSQLQWSEKLQNFARDAEIKLQDLARQAESRLRDALRDADMKLSDAETRRIDQLAQTRQEFQNTIRDMLAESVRTTSTLVSTQLVQIQATFDTRVSKLEAGAFTQAGKQSVQDPQTTDAMSRMSNSISALAASTTEALAKINAANTEAMAKLLAGIAAMRENESGTAGSKKGMQDSNARLLSVVMAVAAVASPVIAILVTIMAMRGGVH